MAKGKKTRTKPKVASPSAIRCACGSVCSDPHARLPAYLLIAFGLLALPINFGLIGQLEFAKAWPLLLVLFGFVLLARVQICKLKGE